MSQSVPAEHPPPGGLGAGPVPSVQQDGPCPLPPKAGGTRWPVTTDGNHCHRVPHSLQTPTPRSPGAHRLRTVAGTMKILTCPAQLQRLEEILRKSLPLALPVFGAVLNINRGNPGQYEILVDKWPEFGAVLARPSGEVPVNDGYWNTQTAFYRDLGAYRALVETPGCLPWDAAFTLIGLQDGVTTVSQDLAGKKGVELDIVEYYSYWHPDPSTMPEPRPAPGVRLGSLSPSHVDLLNDTWPYGGNARSRRYLAELLRRFPQVCLQDSSGKPVAWVLTDHFGTGTHSYTLPEHRRHGHMQVALTVAAQRAHARGFPTFGHTALRNQPMQQLQELLGNQRLPGICSYILHNPSLDRDGP